MMPDESFNSYRERVIGLRGNKNFKITNSYGTKEGWRWLKKNKWLDVGCPVTEKQFGQIIKGVNELYIKKFLEGSDIKFPCRMGKLELRKYEPTVRFEDGKMFTNLTVDWVETLRLWHKDKEAAANKTLVRNETNKMFKILYNKHYAVFNNKHYYQFSPARGLKQKLKNKILNNELDAFIL